MLNIHQAFMDALTQKPTKCPIRDEVPRGYYRPDQVHDVPEGLRGLVALYEQINHEEEFEVLKPRFMELCAVRETIEAMVRDALGFPHGTGIGLHADWKVLAVELKDQADYAA